jgi:hypothetical protein
VPEAAVSTRGVKMPQTVDIHHLLQNEHHFIAITSMFWDILTQNIDHKEVSMFTDRSIYMKSISYTLLK